MLVEGKHYRTIWDNKDIPGVVYIIDQRLLPFNFVLKELKTSDDCVGAINDMAVRGAPLIGATAAYGVYIACLEAGLSNNFDTVLKNLCNKLISTRPTAVNLAWAVKNSLIEIDSYNNNEDKTEAALKFARWIADSDVENCKKIGEFGLDLIKGTCKTKPGQPVNILTHCNAGWLATVDYGTATAPIYLANENGISVHVWVDETRPRNQGARLTAWELAQQGIKHTVIVDNAGGHLMQHGMVDMVIVGTDRTTATGDVANKIGTYLKALAAYDNGIPFYVAVPSTSIDWTLDDGIEQIPIEIRNEREVKYIEGYQQGEIREVLLTNEKSPAANLAFDVTPSRLITGLITERGVCKPNRESLFELYPEKR